VLSQILDGSGYNMILVGDLGQGAPRQILLSSQVPDDPKSAAARSNSKGQAAEPEEAPEPEPPAEPVQEHPQLQPQLPQNPFGGAPRSPQEIMQEMQQRQQQMQQQQQPQ
jgi:hypothetical protein